MALERRNPGAFDRTEALKILAVFCMLLDHIAWFFLPFSSMAAQIFHFLGRITAPVMCCFLALGAKRTRNIKRYLLRMLLFALLAQGPWWYLHRNQRFSLNMLFTLFICLLMLHIDLSVTSPVQRLLGIALCFAATAPCDWAFYAPAWCLIFSRCADSRRRETLLFGLVSAIYFAESFTSKLGAGYSQSSALRFSLYTLGVLLALPLLPPAKREGPLTGETPRPHARFWKWFFYAFYPAHLAVLAIIQWMQSE